MRSFSAISSATVRKSNLPGLIVLLDEWFGWGDSNSRPRASEHRSIHLSTAARFLLYHGFKGAMCLPLRASRRPKAIH